MFNPEEFRNNASETVEELMKKVPDEWKSEMAAFISMQAVIFGASNTFEGMGIFELNKIEYLDICNNVLDEEEDETNVYLN